MVSTIPSTRPTSICFVSTYRNMSPITCSTPRLTAAGSIIPLADDDLATLVGYRKVQDGKYHRNVFPIPRLWQKSRTQNPVLARGCGFKSHLRLRY